MRRVLVHGFTQTAASWDGVLEGHAVEVVPHTDLWTTARAIGVEAGRGAYIGYSMGGRLCLHLALDDPQRVQRLVLLGATAGIEDAREREARRIADERMAEEIERDGADAFLERWLSHPMFGHLSEPGPRRRDAATLAACLRRLGTGTQEPLWGRLSELTMPVLVLAGEFDAKFTGIGLRMAEAVGDNARFATVAAAGHAAHLEQPTSFRALVEEFLH